MDIKVKKRLITAFKFLPFIICFIFVIVVSASTETISSVEIDGVEYTINKAEDTITDGENTYEYRYDGSWLNYELVIFYPDGGWYIWKQTKDEGHGHMKMYTTDGIYDNAETLVKVAQEDTPSKPWFLILIVVLIAMLGLLFPERMVLLFESWRFADPKPKPSQTAILVERISSVFVLFLAAIGFIVLLMT